MIRAVACPVVRRETYIQPFRHRQGGHRVGRGGIPTGENALGAALRALPEEAGLSGTTSRAAPLRRDLQRNERWRSGDVAIDAVPGCWTVRADDEGGHVSALSQLLPRDDPTGFAPVRRRAVCIVGGVT